MKWSVFIKVVVILCCLGIIGVIGFKSYFIITSKKSRNLIYRIRVDNFNSKEEYTTTYYFRDIKTGCITFEDGFGVSHIVCKNYTISEY